MQAKLNGKKGLIAAMLTMAIVIGAYNGVYYMWTVSYTISPLMEEFIASVPITIPPTSGATSGEATAAKWIPYATGTGIAEYVFTDAHKGSSLAFLSSAGGVESAARVAIPYGDTLSTISSISFWINIKTATANPTLSTADVYWADGVRKDPGYLAPYITLELDTDGDDIKDDWLVLWHYGEDTKDAWVERSLAEGFHTSWGDGYGVNGDAGRSYWHSIMHSGLATWTLPIPEAYSAVKLGTLADWQGTDLGDAKVLKVKIAIGEWTFAPLEEVYVDDVTINGESYDIDAIVASFDIVKPCYLGVMVTKEDRLALWEDYYWLSVIIEIDDEGYTAVDWMEPIVIDNGILPVGDAYDRGATILAPGTYYAFVWPDYWTCAVPSAVSGDFVINVYAVEV